jgi:hypothetical protein
VSKDAPAPPDYRGAAQEQAAASRELTEQQTVANRPTINTPFGNQTWEQTPTWDPVTGQWLNEWTQNTTLAPDAQAALDSQLDLQRGRSELAGGMLNRAENEYGQEMDWDQFTALANPMGGADDYTSRAEGAIYDKFNDRMRPRFEREQDRTRTQLYNAGLREGDEAYDQQMNDLYERQSDADEQAMYQSIIGGGAEASRMQGLDTNSANFQNATRQQQIAEEMQRRGFSLNEINAIITGQQVGMPQMPGFNTAARSETPNYLGAAGLQGQYNLDQFNSQQGAMQGWLGGATGLVGAAKPFGF